MRGILVIAWVILVGMFASACSAFGSSAVDQTLIAQSEAMETEIANVRATATVEADRVMITLEYAQTAVRAVEVQNDQLRATLVARNFDPNSLDQVVPQDSIGTPAAMSSSGIPITPGSAASSGGDIPQSVPAASTAVPETSLPNLSNIVTAEGVGSNDCALASISQFSTDTLEIYAVATASNVPTGTQIRSRWYLQGQEQVSYDWTPDFDIQEACIWFFIDQNDVTFTPGAWSVQFEINGSPVGTPAQFTITGEVMMEEAMTDDGLQ